MLLSMVIISELVFGFVLMAVLGLTSLRSVYQISAIKNLTGGGVELLAGRNCVGSRLYNHAWLYPRAYMWRTSRA